MSNLGRFYPASKVKNGEFLTQLSLEKSFVRLIYTIITLIIELL